MTILITGSDGSLGSYLMRSCPINGEMVGMHSQVIRQGKSSIDILINELVKRGPVTHVINNHGINHLSWIGTTPLEDEDIYRINVMGPYWVINALVAQQQTCRVINIASATHRVPQRCTALYCASKAALVQMTKVMARELAPKGWVINALAPGLMIDTKMAAMTDNQVLELRGWVEEEAREYAMKMIPMGRATSRAEMATAIWKLFEMPRYVNGICLDVMGGV